MKHLTNEDLIQLLKDWEQAHGETPSRDCWDSDVNTPCSSGLFRQRFGSWGNAIRAAGLTVKKSTPGPKCRKAVSKRLKGKQSQNWKGGRIKDKNGYVLLWMPDHPNAISGRSKAYIFEHRYVMSNHLGRPLEKWEFVHHKNGIKDDNRIENLDLLTKNNHRGMVLCPHCQKQFYIR